MIRSSTVRNDAQRKCARVMRELIPLRLGMALRMFAARLPDAGVCRAYKEARAVWRLEVAP